MGNEGLNVSFHCGAALFSARELQLEIFFEQSLLNISFDLPPTDNDEQGTDRSEALVLVGSIRHWIVCMKAYHVKEFASAPHEVYIIAEGGAA